LSSPLFDLHMMKQITIPTKPNEQIPKTVQVIGKAIQNGTTTPQIRIHSATLATTAPRKNYLAQAKAIFDDVLKNWRYVFDPVGRETVVASGKAAWNLVHGGLGNRLGFGDCDDTTALSGAMLQSIGFPVRIVTTMMPGRRSDSHVYIETKIPRIGWIPFDPVAYPEFKFTQEPPSIRRTRWDLNGNVLSVTGRRPSGELHGVDNMNSAYQQHWDERPLEDLGLAGLDDTTEPDRFETAGLVGFGAAADRYGVIDGFSLGGFAEVELDGDSSYVMTPMIEVNKRDFGYLQRYGRPYAGMNGLGCDGALYAYMPSEDGLSGLWSRIKRGVRKIRKRVRRRAKRIIKKARRAGKYLVKFGKKVKKVALKTIKPVLRKIGKFSKYLAPIAAIVPGIGPAITAGLMATGKVAEIAQKFGVMQSKKTGKLIFKNPKQRKLFQRALTHQAKGLEQFQKLRLQRLRG